MKYNQIKALKKAKNICLIAHNEPDADALCSMFLLKHFLNQKFNLNVDCFAEYSHLPDSYNCLPDIGNLNAGKEKYDFAVMMDSPNADRLGEFKDLFLNAPTRLVIDHHATNEFDPKQNIVKVVSSTCEIVFDILKAYHHKFSKADYGLTYAGIITDTNNLTVGERSRHTFDVVGECVENVECYPIYENFMLNNTQQNMNLLAQAIQSAEYFENGKIILASITKKQAKEMSATQDRYTGIVNRLSTINGARLVAFIYPKEDGYYVSMRGRAGYDVGKLAKQNGGGGHTGAAAFLSDKKLENIKKDVLNQFVEIVKSTQKDSSNFF